MGDSAASPSQCSLQPRTPSRGPPFHHSLLRIQFGRVRLEAQKAGAAPGQEMRKPRKWGNLSQQPRAGQAKSLLSRLKPETRFPGDPGRGGSAGLWATFVEAWPVPEAQACTCPTPQMQETKEQNFSNLPTVGRAR